MANPSNTRGATKIGRQWFLIGQDSRGRHLIYRWDPAPGPDSCTWVQIHECATRPAAEAILRGQRRSADAGADLAIAGLLRAGV